MSGQGRPYTEAEFDELIELYESGICVKRIAHKLGRTPRSIYNLMWRVRERKGVSPRFKREPGHTTSLWLTVSMIKTLNEKASSVGVTRPQYIRDLIAQKLEVER